MKRIITLLVAVAGLLAIPAGVVLAQQGTPEVTRTTLPVNGTVPLLDNPCTANNEQIQFTTGTFENVTHSVVDEAGSRHVTNLLFSIVDDVIGTDLTSGQQYKLEEVDLLPNRNNPQGPIFESTASTTYRVFSVDGGAPEFLAHITFHITRNANDETVVNFTDTTTQCPGA